MNCKKLPVPVHVRHNDRYPHHKILFGLIIQPPKMVLLGKHGLHRVSFWLVQFVLYTNSINTFEPCHWSVISKIVIGSVRIGFT